MGSIAVSDESDNDEAEKVNIGVLRSVSEGCSPLKLSICGDNGFIGEFDLS